MATELRPTDAGIRLAVGVSGSGKTYGVTNDVKRAAASGMPVMVIDRMREWTVGHAGVTTIEAGAKAAEKGAKLIIVRPRDFVAAVEEACAWAIAQPGVAGVAVPEAHGALPNSMRLSGAVEDVATAWRHHKVALWCDTQRLALINRTVTEQACELRIYAVRGELDMRVVKELGGAALVDAVKECARRMRDGEKGWHVKLDVSGLGPYLPQRDKYDAKGRCIGIERIREGHVAYKVPRGK